MSCGAKQKYCLKRKKMADEKKGFPGFEKSTSNVQGKRPTRRIPTTWYPVSYIFIFTLSQDDVYFMYQVHVKALVRWATGERITNRLPPKLSLMTSSLFPPWNWPHIHTGRRATNSRFQFMGAQGEYLAESWHEEIHFSFRSVVLVDVMFELTTNTSRPADDAIC